MGEGKCYSRWVQLMPLSYCHIWPVSAGSQLSHRVVQAHQICWCSKQEMTPYCQPLLHLNCVFSLWQMDYIQNMGVSRWRQYLNLHKHTQYWKLHPPFSKCLLIFFLLGKSRDSCFIQCHLKVCLQWNILNPKCVWHKGGGCCFWDSPSVGWWVDYSDREHIRRIMDGEKASGYW